MLSHAGMHLLFENQQFRSLSMNIFRSKELILGPREHLDLWTEITKHQTSIDSQEIEVVDLDKIFAGYEATVDWPVVPIDD